MDISSTYTNSAICSPADTDLDTGIVLIGRNEGERLQRCLISLQDLSLPVVYVDSGSTDGSVSLARHSGCAVVELDIERPFTAARARNAGLDRLLRSHPQLTYVQFIDGDCVLDRQWLPAARVRLERRPDLAIVCGRRREMWPEATIYNRLCDMEWDTTVGETDACGGDFLARVAALREVGGFDPAVVAGEEPEMCFRLRRSGWRIERMDCEMTLHDAALTRFGQYWQRARRSGHAYAQSTCMHWRAEGKFQWRQAASILFWAAALPLAVLSVVPLSPLIALLLLFAYPALWMKMFLRRIAVHHAPVADAARYATFILLAKFAELSGIWEFLRLRLRRRPSTIIEYK